MADHNACLRFASYSVSLGSVPSKFDVPSDILILSNSVVPNHNFKLEKEIVAKADKEREAAEQLRKAAEEKVAPAVHTEPQQMTATATAESKPAVDESPLLDLNFDLSEADQTPAVTTAAVSAGNGSSTAAPASANAMETTTIQPPPKPDNDALVTMMMGTTKQDREVCFFYLECADWNLESAVELLKSMQAISN